ncbi:MAG: hypothetical protein MUF23_15880 [Pirellula sp.]|nr:hypothetical protein [Pirellula sp.]
MSIKGNGLANVVDDHLAGITICQMLRELVAKLRKLSAIYVFIQGF